MSKREDDFEKSAMDYCEDHSHCIYFEAGCEHGYQYALQHPHWIPVEERLPPRAESSFIFSDYVLVCDNIGYMDTACYNFEKNRWDWLNNVTHWMPLPEAPRKEE